MKIKQGIEKVPGGMMVVPLLLGAIVHTFFPTADKTFVGFTGSYLTGTSAILFVFFFCVGTNINLKSSGKIAAKGMSLLLVKVLFAALLGVIVNMFLPRAGITSGVFAGFSVLAVIASFNAANGGLFVALMSTIPDREVDVASYPFFSAQSGPFFTMITLGVAGIGQFPWQALVSTLIPFGIGMLLGNLDPELKKMFSPLQGALVPFFAFTIGFSLDLQMILQSGLVGILMGLAVVFIIVLVRSLYRAFRWFSRLGGIIDCRRGCSCTVSNCRSKSSLCTNGKFGHCNCGNLCVSFGRINANGNNVVL